MTIIRTPTRAEGGITEEEKVQLEAHSQMWIKRILRTEPTDREQLTQAIRDLYRVSDLKEPNVSIVNSPIIMAAAYGAAAAMWYVSENDVDIKITPVKKKRPMNPVYVETWNSVVESIVGSKFKVPKIKVNTEVVEDVSDSALQACRDMAGDFGIACSKKWYRVYQGGAYWAQYDSYLTGLRDVIGLQLPVFDKYEAWERAAIYGTFRVMHEKFCIVSDFPSKILMDEENRAHCENGPSHQWRDGLKLYHWHGVQVPEKWIMDRENVEPSEVLTVENVEQRAAGAEIIGWAKMAEKLDMRVIDGSPDTDLGALVEMTLPGLDSPGRFLMAKCPRNGTICEGVPEVSDIDNLPIDTAVAAQAWRIGDPQSEYEHPQRRT